MKQRDGSLPGYSQRVVIRDYRGISCSVRVGSVYISRDKNAIDTDTLSRIQQDQNSILLDAAQCVSVNCILSSRLSPRLCTVCDKKLVRSRQQAKLLTTYTYTYYACSPTDNVYSSAQYVYSPTRSVPK